MLRICTSPFIWLSVSTANCRHGSFKGGFVVQAKMGASKLRPRMKLFPFTVAVQGCCVSSNTISLGRDCISLVDCIYTAVFISEV